MQAAEGSVRNWHCAQGGVAVPLQVTSVQRHLPFDFGVCLWLRTRSVV